MRFTSTHVWAASSEAKAWGMEQGHPVDCQIMLACLCSNAQPSEGDNAFMQVGAPGPMPCESVRVAP